MVALNSLAGFYGLTRITYSRDSAIITSPWSGSNGQIINFPDTDLDGNQRIINNIDIGAYEFDSSLGIPAYEKNSFTLYPNPSNGIFNISSESGYDSFSVYNIQGIQIFHKFKESGMNNIDLTNYANGLYFVHFFINSKEYVYKIINN